MAYDPTQPESAQRAQSSNSLPPAAGEAAHTPTPWTFDEVVTDCGRCFRIGSREIIDGHEASKSLGARTLPAYACIYDDYGSGETVNKANAAFIVRACNEYAQLKAENEELKRKVLTPSAAELEVFSLRNSHAALVEALQIAHSALLESSSTAPAVIQTARAALKAATEGQK